jgi:hypothetical protein
MSALRTGRLCPPGNTPSINFYWKPSQPQGHSAAGSTVCVSHSEDEQVILKTCKGKILPITGLCGLE